MLRRIPACLILVIALLAVAPLLHQHPLQTDVSVETAPRSICAVCATGVGRLPVVAPSVAAPVVIVYTYTSLAVPIVTFEKPLPLPSRAPPAA